MSAQTYEIVEKSTAPLLFALLGDDIDLTGGALEILVHDVNGQLCAMTSCAFVSAAAGTVTVSPAADSLLATATPHKARFKVTLGGATYYFPNSKDRDTWLVGPE